MSTTESRRDLGQWYTPKSVAQLAMALAWKPARDSPRVLDPSCGDGIFLETARERGLCRPNLVGVDVDVRAIEAARDRVPEASLVHQDFFTFPRNSTFDLIVGNPPYVRQERLGSAKKKLIIEALAQDWPQLDRQSLDKLVGRGDLAAPFLLRIVRLLREGGRAALVLSSALLDSVYGVRLWRILTKVASVEIIVEAPQEKWFEDASVHTVIVVLRAEPSTDSVRIGKLHCSTEEAARMILSGKELSDVAQVRHVSADSPEAWASALRAPDTWYRFVEAAADAVTTLGDVAELRRGITSGANDIFYVPRSNSQGIPARFLVPMMRSPNKEEQGSIEFDSESSSQFGLVVNPTEKIAESPELQSYLAQFPDAHNRKSLSSRSPWWSIRGKAAQVFMCKSFADRFVQPFSIKPVLADQRLYCVYPNPDVDAELLAAILNGSATALALESLGRASMGQGVLEWSVGDMRELPVLDPRKIENPGEVLSAFLALRSRTLGSVNATRACQYRGALDSALLATWGEIRQMQGEIVSSLCLCCQARTERGKK